MLAADPLGDSARLHSPLYLLPQPIRPTLCATHTQALVAALTTAAGARKPILFALPSYLLPTTASATAHDPPPYRGSCSANNHDDDELAADDDTASNPARPQADATSTGIGGRSSGVSRTSSRLQGAAGRNAATHALPASAAAPGEAGACTQLNSLMPPVVLSPVKARKKSRSSPPPRSSISSEGWPPVQGWRRGRGATAGCSGRPHPPSAAGLERVRGRWVRGALYVAVWHAWLVRTWVQELGLGAWNGCP